ncbi:hypothetical protein GGR54DRAFT_649544 [Hypoxylon sp. NC1633]|nr:hypothetical protein GGR54DRAFT_649544 [Hypoxylon sp. NC1633]
MRPLTLLTGLVVFYGGIAMASKKRLIIDTDLLSFDDDPLAVGLANIFQSWGQVELIGVFSCISSRFAPPGIDAINTFFGHPNIPTAVRKPVDYLHPEFGEYITGLTDNFVQDVKDGANTPDPGALIAFLTQKISLKGYTSNTRGHVPVLSYRYLLSTSEDNSITIAVIGFWDNIYQLLNSGPDDISPHTGAELLSSKVRELVIQSNDVGDSYNIYMRNATFAQAVLNWWPGRLVFANDDVGESTVIGTRITTELDVTKNPLGYALRANIGYGQKHYVWDAVAIYYAVCGLDDIFHWKYEHAGHAKFNGSGTATWEDVSGPSLQNSLAFSVPNTTFSARLENILLWEPGQHIPKGRSWCNN